MELWARECVLNAEPDKRRGSGASDFVWQARQCANTCVEVAHNYGRSFKRVKMCGEVR